MKSFFRYQHFFKMIFLILLFLLNGNCSIFQVNKYTDNTLPVKKGVILEVITEAGETSYPPGQVLDLKLYDNKEVEFDFYKPDTPDRIGIQFSSERKQSTISQEDFNEIKSLLNNSDLLNAKNYYAPSINISVDSRIKKIITFKAVNQEKNIVLEERDSHLHLKEKLGKYPESLVMLLEKVENINRELRKHVD